MFDAYALIYRAFYAFINRPMINSKGVNTSAIYGFTTILMDILKRENPEYAAVVFDPPSPTFRHEMYSQYKANRLATPEEIKKSVPWIKTLIEAYNIPVIEVNRYEADDVIGTIARKAEKAGFTTIMVTPDKDYMQLVNEKTMMLKPTKSAGEYEMVDTAKAMNFFSVDNTSSVTDVLALWGDSSDNIPGAPGIGEKTAKELISKYKTLDNLFSHVADLKPKQRETLISNQEQIKLSYQLAKIVTDVPIDLNINDLQVQKSNEKKLKEIFTELEFKTLLARMLKTTAPEPVQGSLFAEVPTSEQESISNFSSISSVPHKYHLVADDEQLERLLHLLDKQHEFCFDTETTGLNTWSAEMVGMSFSFTPHEAYYVPIPQDQIHAGQIINRFRTLFGNPAIRKVGQNLKFDIQVLMKYNIAVEGELFDTMIAHYLIQPDLKHNLDYLAEIYLKYSMVPIEDLIGKKGMSTQKSMRDVDLDVIREYAGEDADITWQLYPILKKELQNRNLWKLAGEVEMPLVRVLAEMERSGFRINRNSLKEYSDVLQKELSAIESSIYDAAGVQFNINSPKQLGEILFEKMKIADGTQKTKTKQFSTSEEVLQKLTDKHPVVNQILEYRGLQKLLNTYVEALPVLVDPQTGKIHSSFDQAWVSTGRLSSRNPNLQNIPIRDERGKEIRRAFIPSDDRNVLLSADYSQIELRLMAHLSRDANMIAAFRNNEDIHISTAAKVFKVSEKEVTPSMRSSAKTANFGIIYGISSFGLSQRLNISRSDASFLIQGYFESFPRIKEYMDDAVLQAREKGYVETIMGRRRYLPDINSSNAIVRGVAERNAINAPIQGSAADIIKLAMVNIQRQLRNGFKTTLILQVHDELIFDVCRDELERIEKLVRYEMEQVMNLEVPLVVDIGTGSNWLEAH